MTLSSKNNSISLKLVLHPSDYAARARPPKVDRKGQPYYIRPPSPMRPMRSITPCIVDPCGQPWTGPRCHCCVMHTCMGDVYPLAVTLDRATLPLRQDG